MVLVHMKDNSLSACFLETPWEHGFDDCRRLTSENEGYALVGVLILHQSQWLQRVGVCICLAWIPKVVICVHIDRTRCCNVAKPSYFTDLGRTLQQPIYLSSLTVG